MNFFEKTFFKEEKKPEEIQAKKPEGVIEKKETSHSSPEEEVLTSREKTKSSELSGGCNKTIFVELKDDGAGVFKPKDGEKKGIRYGVEAGTYYKRERAAYLVDRFLGNGEKSYVFLAKELIFVLSDIVFPYI